MCTNPFLFQALSPLHAAPATRRIEIACANIEEAVAIRKYLLGFLLLVIYRVMPRGEAYC